MSAQLTDLQKRVLGLLADLSPHLSLSGGAALAAFHLGHRTTRDLGLFVHGAESIAELRRETVARLRAGGLDVRELRSLDAFATIEAVDGAGESVVVDLVAEPVATLEPPQERRELGFAVRVDTAHEILVNKLCALLHRSEPRDLFDLWSLGRAGGDLRRGLEDAPRKDGGFSALTLGWVLRGWNLESACRAAGFEAHLPELLAFRDELLRMATDGAP